MITIKTIGDERLYGKIARVAKKFKNVAREDLYEIATLYSQELAKGIMQAGLNNEPLVWTGRLLDSTRNILPDEEGYTIELAPYAFPIDRMKPTIVAPRRHPSLARWFEEKRGYVPRYALIRPHPFMNNAFRRARYRLRDGLYNLKTLKEVESI